jgi:hypothetical protein
MNQILALIVLFSGIHATAQERQLSPKARELTQALAVLRASPDNSPAQERYLKTFPHEYTEFLNLFDVGRELSDGYDFIDALSLTEKDHAAELGALLLGLAKDAHYKADAPSYLQHVTAAYASRHPSTFAELFKQLPSQKQTQLITFLADVEAHSSYREYQAIIDGLKRIGEDKLAMRFEEARTKRERQPHDPKSP